MESGVDHGAHACVSLHEDQRKLRKRDRFDFLQPRDAMALRIDDVETVLRLKDGFDIDRLDSSPITPKSTCSD